MTTITLQTPIQRGTTTIAEINLRKPTAGELRGLSMAELLRMEVGAVCALLPRISQPTLTPAEVNSLDPADLFELGTEAASFFLKQGVLPPESPSA